VEHRAVDTDSKRNGLQLSQRVAESLRQRLFPHSGLRPKQLAYIPKVSERTVWNLLSGNQTPSGETLDALRNFFGSDFISEVFQFPVVKLSEQRIYAALKKLDEWRDEFRAATGGREE